MQQAGPPSGDTPDYLDSKVQQSEQPGQQELFPQPLENDIYKDGDGDLDLAQDGGGDGFSGGMDNDKGSKTARALELQEKNRSGPPYILPRGIRHGREGLGNLLCPTAESNTQLLLRIPVNLHR